MSATPISDEALIHLKDLDHLKWLRLNYTEITDEELKQLHGMKSLFWVSLVGTKTTEAGARELLATLKNGKKIVGQWNGRIVSIEK